MKSTQSIESAAAELRAAYRREFEAAPSDALFPPHIIAVITGRSQRWLELARYSGRGPLFVRTGGKFVRNRRGDLQLYGGRALYKKCDVEAFLWAEPRYRSAGERVDDRAAA